MANQHLSAPELGVTQEIANLTGGVVVGTVNMLSGENLDLGNAEVFTFDTPQELFAMLPASGALASMTYQSGFTGPLAFVLGLNTAAGLADLMMGNPPGAAASEISDMQLSAIGEAMSQMTGAISSNMSQFLSQPVDLSSPDMAPFSHEVLLATMPQLAMAGIALLKYTLVGAGALANAEIFQVAPLADLQQQVAMVQSQVPEYAQMGAPAMAGVGAGDPMMGMGGVSASGGGFQSAPGGPVTVQQVEFTSFDNHVATSGALNKNLELVMDVTLNLTVELGRTELSIKEVLELTRGSVIELNRIAGEPVDLFANGKMIAKGEVVVIEDNFGIRITSIVAPADRLRGL